MSGQSIRPGTPVEVTTAYGVEFATFVRFADGLVYLDREDGSRYRTEAIRVRPMRGGRSTGSSRRTRSTSAA